MFDGEPFTQDDYRTSISGNYIDGPFGVISGYVAMAAVMLCATRREGEAVDIYIKRRNRAAAEFSRESGLWSKHWFGRALEWDAHVRRGHNPYSWPTLLANFHGEDWLEEQRMLTNYHGTQTRCQAGRPAMRWHEGIKFAQP